MKNKKRILLCYTELLHYRIDILKALSVKYDLTVVHSGQNITENKSGFRELVLPVHSMWKFRYQVGLLPLLRGERFDAVIFFLDLAWLSIVLGFLLCPRYVRKITWGLWITKFSIANFSRLILACCSDANIFYSKGAARDFLKRGLPKNKIHVALNTFAVQSPERNESTNRDSILFVGTFNSRKQNDTVILAFSNAVRNIPKELRLVFVGDGFEKSKIMALAETQHCSNRIEFYPKETHEKGLKTYYDRAIFSISFGQAGLSVLQSFAFGVPFVTHKDAISGGEIENITNGHNGILCDGSQISLQKVIEDISCNKINAADLGRNALAYYIKNASLDKMLEGFISAIEGCQQSQEPNHE